MRTLLHLPLESYKSRYTEQLQGWETAEFSKNFNVEEIVPSAWDTSIHIDIRHGEVLDTIQRPMHALGQMQALLHRIAGEPGESRIYFSDFFHPGLSALPYSRKGFKASAFLWAQTFDYWDFTTRFDWMRDWERAAFGIYSDVFVASRLLARTIETSLFPALGTSSVHVVGLPFNSKSVFAQLGELPLSRDIDVVWSSRFDIEKNPNQFLQLVESMEGLNCAICTGHETLRGSDSFSVEQALRLAANGTRSGSKLTIYSGLTKSEYYTILARSKVQFNAARQDWVSFTLLEALTFGCLPLYPLYENFVEVFHDFPAFMYSPEQPAAIAEKVFSFTEPLSDQFRSYYEAFRTKTLSHHDGTLSRIAKIINEQ